MKPIKKGLGKGLDALLGDYQEPDVNGVNELDIRLLDTNIRQPRKQFDDDKLDELAKSIQQHGMVQPIIVRKNGERYSIVAGERRFRAARLAGLEKVPVIIKDYDEKKVMEVALIENIQREDLNPIEEAAAIKFLMQQHDLTQEEVAERISKSRPAIANTLRLLNLPEQAQQLLQEGKLSAGHAKVLVGLDDNALILALANETVAKGYSVRQLEQVAKQAQTKSKGEEKKDKPVRELPPDLYSAQETMRERLGTKVSISGDSKKGRIVIEYFSENDLKHIYEIIEGNN